MKAINKMKQRFNEGYALNFEVSCSEVTPPKDWTERTRAQELIYRFTLDAACEFLFETTLQTLDSKLAYPHTYKSRSGDHSSAMGSEP
jgi:hypothetical protein